MKNATIEKLEADRAKLIAKLRELLESDDIIAAANPELVEFLKEFDP